MPGISRRTVNSGCVTVRLQVALIVVQPVAYLHQLGPAGRSPSFRPLCSLGPVGPGGDGGQVVRVRQVVGVLAFALTALGPSAGAVGVVQRHQWSTSRSVGLVIVWPVKAPYHCPVLTRHRRSVLYVTAVRLSAISTIWRVSWQTPSWSVQWAHSPRS